MDNRTNQPNQQSTPSASQTTSYEQDSANSSRAMGSSQNSSEQGGIIDTITSTVGNIQVPDALKNVQLPQAVKDFGATCSRTYSGLSTTQKVIGGAALALGATYWAATSNGWMGMCKSEISGKKSGNRNR